MDRDEVGDAFGLVLVDPQERRGSDGDELNNGPPVLILVTPLVPPLITPLRTPLIDPLPLPPNFSS